jgi:hypothetical protein
VRWFENPNAPEFLQTSANFGGASTSGQRADGAAAERIGAALRLVAPVVIDAGALAAISYGCFLAWTPLGFIVPGAIVMTLSIYADLRRSAATRSAGETKP